MADPWRSNQERPVASRTALRSRVRNRAQRNTQGEIPKAKYGYRFPGCKQERPLLNMVMLTPRRRMSRHGITVHGFRSTFRDRIAECTDCPDSLAEEALAHVIILQTMAVYRRRDQFKRRRVMMEDQDLYCGKGAGRRYTNGAGSGRSIRCVTTLQA
ncbi:hypothetical protein [Paraburkholderia xenovorans]